MKSGKEIASMFIGRYSSRMGAKGRVAVPIKFRQGLGSRAIISQGYKKALFLVAKPQWEQLTEPFVNQPLTVSPMVRDIERFLFGSAYEIEFDDQGRIVIPQELRQFAGLDGEAVFLGLGKRVEIWSRSNWESYAATVASNIEGISTEVAKIGNRVPKKDE